MDEYTTEELKYKNGFDDGYRKGDAEGYARGLAEASARRGHWVPVFESDSWNNWVQCSECQTVGSPFWKRCPMCEAKMEV